MIKWLPVFLLCLSSPLYPIDTAIFDDSFRVELVDESSPLQELLALFSTRHCVEAGFTEERYFAFRKEPVRLRGSLCYLTGVGLSLLYEEGDSKQLIFKGKELIRYAAVDDARSVYPVDADHAYLEDVMAFNLPALENDFNVYFQTAGDQWLLGLQRREKVVRGAKGNNISATSIVLQGNGSLLHTIAIRNANGFERVIQMEDVSVIDSVSDALKQRYFPE